MRKLLRHKIQLRNGSRCRLWFALFFVAAFPAFSASFTTSLDRDTISMGETPTLTLTFEGGSPRSISGLPKFPNLQIADRGSSQSFNMVNGQMSSSVSDTLAITPTQPGENTLPALQ